MTEEDIVITEYQGTGGDCISHYRAKFRDGFTPTLKEFVDYVLSITGEWGGIYTHTNPINVLKYSKGEIKQLCPNYYELLDKKIKLLRKDGGWTAMDYLIDFVDENTEENTDKMETNSAKKIESISDDRFKDTGLCRCSSEHPEIMFEDSVIIVEIGKPDPISIRKNPDHPYQLRIYDKESEHVLNIPISYCPFCGRKL